jgi:YidC/Oxa1 family membrane protein insertase
MSEEQDQKSIQLRALLAFALSAAVLFVYQYFMVKPTPSPQPAKTTAPAAPAKTTPAPAAPATPVAAPPPGAEAASAEQTFVVETDNYLVSLTNRGAVVTSWTLKQYKADTGRPLELVNSAAVAEAGYPFSVHVRENPPAVDLNQTLFRAETSNGAAGRLPAPVEITFRWSDGKIQARKRFRFSRNSYLVEVESDLTQGSTPVPHLLAWRGGFGDAAVTDAARTVRTFYFDPAANKITHLEASAAEKAPVLNAGNYVYAGIEDKYFAAAFLSAEPGRQLQLETSALQTATARESKKQLFAGAAVGFGGVNRFLVYVGPKKIDLLRSIREPLAQLVDFGFFGFIAYPLFLMLSWIHRYVPNFGWAIILLTIFINFVLFPLKLKSMKSMKKMQKLQPLIKHINDKYKGMSLRDAKRQQQNQEVMELYQKYGVNPLGGCLPMVLQLPFFFAFYQVLTISIEMRHAPWLWVQDLSEPEHMMLGFLRVLPILMIATQFWYQKMTPATTVDPAQQKMMQFMPLIMGFFFYGLSSGLVLYWLTGNLVGIAQQWFINRLPEPELDLEMSRKGKAKKGKG